MSQERTAAAARLEALDFRIRQACEDVERRRESVTLVAISKTFPAEAIRPFLDAGQRVFGENRVQEAAGKWPALRADIPDVELHLIGQLQTNKAEEAVRLFDVIETLDRIRLAEALAGAMAKTGRRPRVLVQVNTGEEAQKGGVPPKEADGLIARCRALELPLAGLMCIPPEAEPPSPHFALLAKIARRNGLETLSMGMSGDFPAAIQCGATHIRVGSALFGSR